MVEKDSGRIIELAQALMDEVERQGYDVRSSAVPALKHLNIYHHTDMPGYKENFYVDSGAGPGAWRVATNRFA
jgi:hypothetical protein